MSNMELIDKTALLKTLRAEYRECAKDAEEVGGEAVLHAEELDSVIDIVSKASVVRDIGSVSHGQWIMRGGRFHCSSCDAKAKWDCEGGIGGWSREYEQAKTPYCPNCGAIMDTITDKEDTDGD